MLTLTIRIGDLIEGRRGKENSVNEDNTVRQSANNTGLRIPYTLNVEIRVVITQQHLRFKLIVNLCTSYYSFHVTATDHSSQTHQDYVKGRTGYLQWETDF
jgi:hypothetical protein